MNAIDGKNHIDAKEKHLKKFDEGFGCNCEVITSEHMHRMLVKITQKVRLFRFVECRQHVLRVQDYFENALQLDSTAQPGIHVAHHHLDQDVREQLLLKSSKMSRKVREQMNQGHDHVRTESQFCFGTFGGTYLFHNTGLVQHVLADE